MQNAADKKSSKASGSVGDSTPFHNGPMELEEIRDAVATANVPVLLMLVYQSTGAAQWLEPPYCPTRGKGLLDHDSGQTMSAANQFYSLARLITWPAEQLFSAPPHYCDRTA